MILDRLSEDINIKDLVIQPEKEPMSRLDSILEVTGDQWQEILGMLDHPRNNDLKILTASAFVYPDKTEELFKKNFFFWPRSFNQLRMMEIRALGDARGTDEYALLLANTRLLLPERAEELKIHSRLWSVLMGRLNTIHGVGNSLDFIFNASVMKTIKPEFDPQLDQELIDKLVATISSLYGDRYPFYLSRFRLISPTEFKKIPLDRDKIEPMYQQLERFKETDLLLFAERAFDLKLVTAQEVELTARGLEITDYPPLNFEEQVHPMPVRRAF